MAVGVAAEFKSWMSINVIYKEDYDDTRSKRL